MTTKFNQELYAKIKTKKNEPLSNIDTQRLRVVKKEKEKEVTEKGLSTLPWKKDVLLPLVFPSRRSFLVPRSAIPEIKGRRK